MNVTETKRTFEEPVLLSVYGACRQLDVSRTTLYFLVRDGQLACVNIGRRKLFRPADLRAFADAKVQIRGFDNKEEVK